MVLPGKSEVKVLNPTAVHIYSLLDGNHTLEEIAQVLYEEYDVTLEEARRDVREFVETLDGQGMLAGGNETGEASS